MNLNCDTFIKQEFVNAEDKLSNSLPHTDLNIHVKNEPILDDSFSSVVIKNETLTDDTFIEGSATIKTEESSDAGTGDSFVIYEYETDPIINRVATVAQQTSEQIPKGISPWTISNVGQNKQTLINKTNHALVGNIEVKHVTAAAMGVSSTPILLNTQLRKRHKVVLPINPVDKRTRYNIEGTTSPPINNNTISTDLKNCAETSNASALLNSGSKKIINHLMKHKRIQRIQEDALRESPAIPRNPDNKIEKTPFVTTNYKESLSSLSPVHTSEATATAPSPVVQKSLNSPKQSVPDPPIISELRVKCLCSLTDVTTTDNSEMKTFFKQMFEETRNLNKTQQRKVKMSLLKAISNAEELIEQGKCCDFS